MVHRSESWPSSGWRSCNEEISRDANATGATVPTIPAMKFVLPAVAVLFVALGSLPAGSDSDRAPGPSAQRRETYLSASIDPSGRLAITTADGRAIVVPKEGEQTSFGEPTVSADRTAAGAQAYYANCCTSYDIPLQLVVYSSGKAHRFTGNKLPIFQWHFADAGTRIAFGQEPVHFGCEIHYELREIDSERLIDSAEVPQPCGLRPSPAETFVPQWVKELNAKRQ